VNRVLLTDQQGTCEGSAIVFDESLVGPAAEQPPAQSALLGRVVEVEGNTLSQIEAASLVIVMEAAQGNRTVACRRLRIDNKTGKLKVGTPVKALITGKTVQNAWKIPGSAVITAQDGAKSVMVIGSDSAAHKKTVTLGIADGDDVQILNNSLSPSDNVITSGAYGLDEGTKVKIGPAEGSDEAKPEASKGEDKNKE